MKSYPIEVYENLVLCARNNDDAAQQWLVDNDYREMSEFWDAFEGVEKSFKWLMENGYRHLAATVDAMAGDGKAKVFLITFRMEKELPKKSILENYVNIIEWGDGIFGIKKASMIYFNKNPEELSASESARLAAVIPSPLHHDPSTNSRYVNRRSAIIRGRLNDIQLFPDKVK